MLWSEPGEQRVGLIATVAPVAPIDKQYSYVVPDEMSERLQPGHRVQIPMGRSGRLHTAFCLHLEKGPWTSTLRPIESLVDPVSYLDPRLLELGRWIARHYACPLGRTLNAIVPAAVKQQRGFRKVRRAELAQPLERIQEEAGRLGPKQRRLLEYLSNATDPVEIGDLRRATGVSSETVRTAERRGWVGIAEHREPQAAPDFDRPCAEPTFTLTDEQQAALQCIDGKIDRACFSVVLLFGVSGSGKTEVYIRAMRRVLADGRQVILLVPEIALTTQLLGRLAGRFTDVAVVHSGLTEVQRSLIWNEIASGKKRVIIGTRSAVFAPCKRLGLIVVDEEQETSFKNLQAPRFHVRDVAVKRGQLEDIPILLGSATPSLESWFNCQSRPHYTRVDLNRRARSQPLPKVHLVDMREEYTAVGQVVVLSRLLEQKLARTLQRNEQAILLLNRRGFANWLYCPRCRQRVECPRCNAAMVFHVALRMVICHYCGRRDPAPKTCPMLQCGTGLVEFGSGTQRVEEVLQRRFPDKRIVRADSDTLRHRSDIQRLIDDVEAGRVDVVAGTQMIAKGLDFPRVSFVGVIGGDAVWASADFRAGERLFQLMTQVAGRAGRGELSGEVVVQTMDPDAPPLRAAIEHDFSRFAESELPIRRKYAYPPFTRLTRIVLAHPDEAQARSESEAMARRIEDAAGALNLPETQVLGPMACMLNRVRGQYRFEVLLRSGRAEHMQTLFDHLRSRNLLKAKARTVTVDVDPVSLT